VTSDPDGTNEQILTVPGQPGYEDRAPQWSPDGEMITWMAQEDEQCCGDRDIWAMNENGSGKTNLTNFGGDPYGDMFPSWSPDGGGGEDAGWAPGEDPGGRLSGFLGGKGSGGVRSNAAAPGIYCVTADALPSAEAAGVSDCVEDYAPGTRVRLVVRAAAGSVFTGWRGACAGTATACWVTVGPETKVAAVFQPQR